MKKFIVILILTLAITGCSFDKEEELVDEYYKKVVEVNRDVINEHDELLVFHYDEIQALVQMNTKIACDTRKSIWSILHSTDTTFLNNGIDMSKYMSVNNPLLSDPGYEEVCGNL